MELQNRLHDYRMCCEQGADCIYETPLDYIVKLEKRSSRKWWFRAKDKKIVLSRYTTFFEFMREKFPIQPYSNPWARMHQQQMLIRFYIKGWITKEQMNQLLGYEVKFVNPFQLT